MTTQLSLVLFFQDSFHLTIPSAPRLRFRQWTDFKWGPKGWKFSWKGQKKNPTNKYETQKIMQVKNEMIGEMICASVAKISLSKQSMKMKFSPIHLKNWPLKGFFQRWLFIRTNCTPIKLLSWQLSIPTSRCEMTIEGFNWLMVGQSGMPTTATHHIKTNIWKICKVNMQSLLVTR